MDRCGQARAGLRSSNGNAKETHSFGRLRGAAFRAARRDRRLRRGGPLRRRSLGLRGAGSGRGRLLLALVVARSQDSRTRPVCRVRRRGMRARRSLGSGPPGARRLGIEGRQPTRRSARRPPDRSCAGPDRPRRIPSEASPPRHVPELRAAPRGPRTGRVRPHDPETLRTQGEPHEEDPLRPRGRRPRRNRRSLVRVLGRGDLRPGGLPEALLRLEVASLHGAAGRPAAPFLLTFI